MSWKLQAVGLPQVGEPLRWEGSVSARALPHAVLACRAAVLNLLADGASSGIRAWSAVGAITHARASARPVTVAYADVVVPGAVPRLTEASFSRRTIFDVLVKMKDPGQTIAELEALANRQRLGPNPITSLLDYSVNSRPIPSIYELARIL